MPDRRRLVRIAYDGTVSLVRDLEDSTKYFAVRDSFTIKPGQRKQVQASVPRRYAGSRPVAETHDNGSIGWRTLVAGTSSDDVLANVEAMLGNLESAIDRLWFEWRPDGATGSVYYEIRGPASWTPSYSWVQFAGARSMYVDVEIPVAPLAWGDQIQIEISSVAVPEVVQFATDIPGDAPALMDLEMTNPSGGSDAPIWALIGWAQRPGSPLSGSVRPFGFVGASSAGSLSGFVATADSDYRDNLGLIATASGAGSGSARWTIDPSVMAPDEFTPDEIDLEFWARVALDSTLVAPNLTLSLLPLAGATFGGEQFTGEFGSVGRPVTLPASGTKKFRVTRLGVLSLPVDTGRPLKWSVKLAASWGAGSTGDLGVDSLFIVPARQRAVSVSGKPNDAGYGAFIGSTGAATKTIRSDLSGLVASGAGNPGRSPGLGGSPLELPPGEVDLFIKLSNLVADDPTSDATSDLLSFPGLTGQARITPRYWLAKGA